LAVIVAVVAVIALASTLSQNGSVFGGSDYIARVEIRGIIRGNQDRVEALEKLGKEKSAKAVIVHVDSPGGTTSGAEQLYDAVILDLGLPQRPGLDVLRAWRARGNTVPVLVLTARDAWHEKVEGFRAGADATGATLELVWGEVDYLDLNTSWPLARRYQTNAESLGRSFFPYEKLPPGMQGSTDMGNVSHRVPSIHPMIAVAPPHVAIHNAEFAKWAGSDAGDRAVLDGAKALAMTALDFFCDAGLRAEVEHAFAAGASAS